VADSSSGNDPNVGPIAVHFKKGKPNGCVQSEKHPPYQAILFAGLPQTVLILGDLEIIGSGGSDRGKDCHSDDSAYPPDPLPRGLDVSIGLNGNQSMFVPLSVFPAETTSIRMVSGCENID
jgi:hypothetical protein